VELEGPALALFAILWSDHVARTHNLTRSMAVGLISGLGILQWTRASRNASSLSPASPSLPPVSPHSLLVTLLLVFLGGRSRGDLRGNRLRFFHVPSGSALPIISLFS